MGNADTKVAANIRDYGSKAEFLKAVHAEVGDEGFDEFINRHKDEWINRLSIADGFIGKYSTPSIATQCDALIAAGEINEDDHDLECIRNDEVNRRFETVKMFAACDADQDGTITFDEYFKYRCGTLKNVYPEQKAKFKKEFDQFDKNKDGVLDFEEIISFGMPKIIFDNK